MVAPEPGPLPVPELPLALDPAPVLPDYAGACVSGIVPALLDHLDHLDQPNLDHPGSAPGWIAPLLASARQVVVLVVDGLGWDQLQSRRHIAPALASMAGGPITTVVPSTTSTALTSIFTGTVPAEHGVLGYRVRLPGDEILNVLRWERVDGSPAKDLVQPTELQHLPAFGGRPVPVVTKAIFADTSFSALYLAGAHQVGYYASSSVAFDVRDALAAGEPLVFAYYDSLDTVAHQHGFGERYDAELAAVDRLVGELTEVLPDGCVLLVTADHGQVEVAHEQVEFSAELLAGVRVMSGEGRFRWLHTLAGATADVAALARQLYGELAWVQTRDEIIDAGWFGGPIASPAAAATIGDVAVLAHAPIAFRDPRDVGKLALRCRHGSLTAAEMFVPLVATAIS
jgi:hypothetical protein